MAVWLIENLGEPADRGMEIDRIDNNGHYEPGNLRWATASLNVSNTRKRRINAEAHAFRMAHPDVRYADATLRRLIGSGLSWPEIVKRWNTPSSKPKGVYGTCSTPDPDIASLFQGSSSRTA
jgi:hypothetical protein